MADWHGLKISDDGRTITVAFHIPTPVYPGDGLNAAGKTIADCLGEDTDHSGVSQVPGLAGQEVTDLAANTLLEIVEDVKLPRGGADSGRRSNINARRQELIPETRIKLRQRYQLWGFQKV